MRVFQLPWLWRICKEKGVMDRDRRDKASGLSLHTWERNKEKEKKTAKSLNLD